MDYTNKSQQSAFVGLLFIVPGVVLIIFPEMNALRILGVLLVIPGYYFFYRYRRCPYCKKKLRLGASLIVRSAAET